MKKTNDANINNNDDQIADLQKQIADLKNQLNERTQGWQRAVADYQNLEKRHNGDKVNFVKFAVKNFILELLSVVDVLEKLHEHLKDQGLELVLKELYKILKNQGVEKISVLNKEFNIEQMEAVTSKEGLEDNKVVEEVRSGYTMYESVLRPARVIVSKKKV